MIFNYKGYLYVFWNSASDAEYTSIKEMCSRNMKNAEQNTRTL